MVLGMTTKSKRRKALETLPPDLYLSFARIIARIRESSVDQAELGITVLMWLHFARRPLQLVELQHALAVENSHTEFDADNIPSKKALLDCCLGLVVIDDETSTVRFVHYTLEEYFCDNTKTEFPNGCCSIAETCLTYLTFGKLRQHCMDDKSLTEIKNEYAFLNYAAVYWGTYVKPQCNDSLIELVKVFVDHEAECPPCAIQALYEYLGGEVAQKFSGIHAIAYFGLSEIMAYFGQVGRNMDLKDDIDQTPLSWAAGNGHEAVVQLLVERDDVDINAKDHHRGWTPLLLAAEYGHEAVVRLLVERDDVDINAKDTDDGWTPLILAAKNGHEAVVRLLVERDDVDINAKDNDGKTPLIWAARNGHEAVARLLVERDGVDINLKDDIYGETPLIWAAEKGHDTIVRLLIEKNDADINAQDNEGKAPLTWAVRNGHEAVVQLLIETVGVDINFKDGVYGETPLAWAAEKGHDAIVRLLIERDDIDINAEDNGGRTPLIWAVTNGHDAVVRLLVDRVDTKPKVPVNDKSE